MATAATGTASGKGRGRPKGATRPSGAGINRTKGTNTADATVDTRSVSTSSRRNESVKKEWRVIIDTVVLKGPLFLAVLYQSYIVGWFSFISLQEATDGYRSFFVTMNNIIFSIFAGLSFDLMIVGTALRNDEKKLSHLATIVAAWVASSAIAYSLFPGEWQQKILHISWTTTIMLFSLSMSEGRFGSFVNWIKNRA